MRRAASAVLAAALCVTAACSHHRVAPDEARLFPTGAVYVQRSGGQAHLVHGTTTVHNGDRVEVREPGAATMELSDEHGLELRPGSQVEVHRQPELLGGDLLVTAPGQPLTVLVAGTAARVSAGAAHLSREPVLLAAYRGTIGIDSAGRTMTVHALRQTAIAAPGLLPPRETPLDYHDLDPWDRRFLGNAIALGIELDSRSRAVTAELTPAGGGTASFYRDLLPGLATESFDDGLLSQVQPGRTVGETLVGAAIAVSGRQHDFRTRWADVFDFRDQGARWGLVALDQQVDRVPVLAAVDEALGRGQPAIAQPAVNASPVPEPQLPSLGEGPTPPTTARRGGNPASGSTTTTTQPTPSSSTTTTVLPRPPATGTPLDQPADTAVDTLNGLLGPLLGAVPVPRAPAATLLPR